MKYKNIRIILGVAILLASILFFAFSHDLKTAVFVFIIVSFGLLALLMNYNHEEKDRNAWDVWFFSMPGLIVVLFFVGILADNIGVWKWIAIALGGSAGLESLSSFIKERMKESKNQDQQSVLNESRTRNGKLLSLIILPSLMVIVTAIMAVATYKLAIEAREARFDDLAPNIEITDVKYQSLDDAGSLMKDWSYLEGESFNIGSVPRAITRLILAIKFSNSGRQMGYVELTNYREILTMAQSGGGSEAYFEGRISVPGRGETGWVYSVDIYNLLGPNKVVSIPYQFDVHNLQGEKILQREADIRCSFYETAPPFVNIECKPVQI